MRSARQLRRSLVSPLTTSTRSRSFLRIQPRSGPSASAWARSSAEGWGQPDPEGRFGYLEGTIRELIITEAETGTREKAVVQLPGGHVIEADLPTDDPFAPMDLPPFEVGQRVELYFSNAPDSQRQYVVSDWVRRPALLWLVALFLVVSVVVARLKGLTTGTSLVIIVSFIVPRILAGWSPITVSLLGVGGILILAIYFVHGLNWSTTAALVGTFMAVVIAMALGVLFSNLSHLTGFGTEDAIMINAAAGQINLKGLLLAGLLVGALGALTDITIVQASVVRELAHVNPEFSIGELYRRGMNVGLDHVGSLVNTLVLAYTLGRSTSSWWRPRSSTLWSARLG